MAKDKDNYTKSECSLDIPEVSWLSESHFVQCRLYGNTVENMLTGGVTPVE